MHVNRVLQDLRRRGLLTLEHRQLVLRDVGGLQRIAEFDKAYLHLGGASDEVRAYFDRLERERG